MANAIAEYEKIMADFSPLEGVSAGQMFGKACLKIHGKAFVAQHNDTLVFKLTGMPHQQALALKGALLWDPSGKGRPMKEWVALPSAQNHDFNTLAHAALTYVAAAL